MEKVVLDLEEVERKYQKLIKVNFPIWRIGTAMYEYKIDYSFFSRRTRFLLKKYDRECERVFRKHRCNSEDHLKYLNEMLKKFKWNDEDVSEYMERLLDEVYGPITI